MRLRSRLVLVVLFVVGFILIFSSFITVSDTIKHASNEVWEENKATVYITPNINIKTTAAPTGLAMNYSQRIVYNRVPKCGSRSILTLFKVLATKNKFRVIEPALNYPYQLELRDQTRISNLMSSLRTPFLYHRHMHFLDFKTFKGPEVTYINLIRDPISRAVSHYYFRRYGDNMLNRTRIKKPIKYFNMVRKKFYLGYKECGIERNI